MRYRIQAVEIALSNQIHGFTNRSERWKYLLVLFPIRCWPVRVGAANADLAHAQALATEAPDGVDEHIQPDLVARAQIGPTGSSHLGSPDMPPGASGAKPEWLMLHALRPTAAPGRRLFGAEASCRNGGDSACAYAACAPAVSWALNIASSSRRGALEPQPLAPLLDVTKVMVE